MKHLEPYGAGLGLVFGVVVFCFALSLVADGVPESADQPGDSPEPRQSIEAPTPPDAAVTDEESDKSAGDDVGKETEEAAISTPPAGEKDMAAAREALEEDAAVAADATESDDLVGLALAEPVLLGTDAGTPRWRAVRLAGSKDAWRIGVGGIWRSVKTRSWSSSSYSQDYPIGAKSVDRSDRYDNAGSLDDTMDRGYHDGYVLQDEWTGLDGDTWNWGYKDSGQVRDNKLRLTWTSRQVTDHRRSISAVTRELKDGGDEEWGVYVNAERTVIQAPHWDCRLHLDFMRVTSSMGGELSNFRDEQTWRKWEEYSMDVYSLDGTGISVDSPPYQGNRDDTGPAINNVPERRQDAGSRLLEERSYTAYNLIRHDLDLQLLTFSMGLAFNYQYRQLSLGGVVGPTINFADTDATYHETLYESWDGGPGGVVEEWRKTRKNTDTTFGCFVQAGAGLRLASCLELGMFGRYDWLENISRNVGQSRYEINPEGGSLGGSLSLVF